MMARIAVVGTVPVIAPTKGGENERERERKKRCAGARLE